MITEHDRPAFVLLRYDEYQRLTGVPTDLARWLEMDEEIDFDIPETGLDIPAATW